MYARSRPLGRLLFLVFPVMMLLFVFVVIIGGAVASIGVELSEDTRLEVSRRSAFRLHPSADAATILVSAAVLAGGQAGLIAIDPVDPGSLEAERRELLPWDRPFAGTYGPGFAKASDALAYAVTLPFMLSLYDAARSHSPWASFWTDVVMLSELFALEAGLNLAVRSLALHPRPLVFSSRAPKQERLKPEASGSFYSGHSSAGFAAAVFLGYTFQQNRPESDCIPWVWAGGLSLATVVAGLRVAAGKHYPSDVFAGALMGGALGWVVPWAHLARHRNQDKDPGPGQGRKWNLDLRPQWLLAGTQAGLEIAPGLRMELRLSSGASR